MAPEKLTGVALDIEIDRVVFGYEHFMHESGPYRVGGYGDAGRVPRYSEDMNDAWRVVHAMRKRRFDFSFSDAGGAGWYCSFAPPPNRPSSSARADLAPVAICQAALKALADRP